MLRIFFFYFWPAVIPILLYIIWFFWANYKLAEDEDPLKWTDGPWVYMVMVTLLIAALCFIPVIQKNTAQRGDEYIPAEYKNHQLIPGRIQ